MYGRWAFILFVILFFCSAVSVLFISLDLDGQTRVFAVIVLVTLFISAFFLLFFTLIRKLAVVVRENKTAQASLKDREASLVKMTAELAELHKGDLHLYSRFGDYAAFSDELSVFNEKITSLCALLESLKAASKSLQVSQIPITDEIQDLLKATTFITENIRKAFDIADNLSTSAKTAFEVSEKVQKGVKQVTTALNDSLSCATALFEQSQQISGILVLLSEISSKINILSINASIVSARTGVHGKAFEVVAKEIRKLASETEKSLNQIAEVIMGIKRVINDVVDKIQYASEQTDAEKTALVSVVGSLQGITLGVEVFRAVSKLAKEKSVTQVNTLTSLTHSCTQFASAFEQLSGMKENLEEILRKKEEVDEKNSKMKTRYSGPINGGGVNT